MSDARRCRSESDGSLARRARAARAQRRRSTSGFARGCVVRRTCGHAYATAVTAGAASAVSTRSTSRRARSRLAVAASPSPRAPRPPLRRRRRSLPRRRRRPTRRRRSSRPARRPSARRGRSWRAVGGAGRAARGRRSLGGGSSVGARRVRSRLPARTTWRRIVQLGVSVEHARATPAPNLAAGLFQRLVGDTERRVAFGAAREQHGGRLTRDAAILAVLRRR